MEEKNGSTKTRLGLSVRQMILLAAVGLSGGAMFALPYLRDTYYVSLMNGLGITDTQMGGMLSMYGFAFLFIGIPCGWLVDRCSTKSILILMVGLTAVGGAWYYTLPQYFSCLIIFIIWSFTTTLYWPVKSKVTKQMGKEHVRAYGYTASMRAAGYAIISAISVALFTAFGEGTPGIKSVIAFYTLILFVMMILIIFSLKKSDDKATAEELPPLRESFASAFALLKNPSIWMLGGVVFCTLSAYICAGMIVPYLESECGMSPQFAAIFGMMRASILPTIAGAISGSLAGKIGGVTRLVNVSTIITVVSGAAMALMAGSFSLTYLFVAIALVAVFAIGVNRCNYMSPLAELNISESNVGMAASLISMIGFSCEMFMYTLVGNMVETYEGTVGYRYVFLLMVAYAVLGSLFAIVLRARINKGKKKQEA